MKEDLCRYMVSTIILKTALPVTNKPLLLLCICCFDIFVNNQTDLCEGRILVKIDLHEGARSI